MEPWKKPSTYFPTIRKRACTPKGRSSKKRKYIDVTKMMNTHYNFGFPPFSFLTFFSFMKKMREKLVQKVMNFIYSLYTNNENFPSLLSGKLHNHIRSIFNFSILKISLLEYFHSKKMKIIIVSASRKKVT